MDLAALPRQYPTLVLAQPDVHRARRTLDIDVGIVGAWRMDLALLPGRYLTKLRTRDANLHRVLRGNLRAENDADPK